MPNRREFPAGKGVLIGIDDGEWNQGGLLFKRRPRSRDSTGSIDGDVHDVVSLHEIDTINGRVRSRKACNLADAPMTYCSEAAKDRSE
ncbi:MAG: hypothetical protein BGO89_09455 [Candidatus Kapaibacterium thiocyanatum]|uniref:Uncharacterized protein n=1 Tax=Candidatus Kapaibacterium thiocyanatum TaxID=1895771 RepID=A0A1M3KWH1_9BACT|nr:MAG: hypothetical protein BGO89_09455 ['Candidatus Kapabacteria' thiocyanatum]